jgi:hypothetical protein
MEFDDDVPHYFSRDDVRGIIWSELIAASFAPS